MTSAGQSRTSARLKTSSTSSGRGALEYDLDVHVSSDGWPSSIGSAMNTSKDLPGTAAEDFVSLATPVREKHGAGPAICSLSSAKPT